MAVRALFGFILSFLLASATFAAGPGYDVVFDLDWTLFYPVKKFETPQTVQIGEEFYQPAEHAVEVLSKLHQSGHRVSLFSGGQARRNQALASYLKSKVQARGARDFSFYKVLNFEDLSRREGTAETDKFAVRFAKDLTKINSDLSHVILVDDLPEFALKGQEKNVFGLGKTYAFHRTFVPDSQGVYDPPNRQEWLRERLKIREFYRLFTEAEGDPEPLVRLKALNQGHGICSKVFKFL
jgi:hypothetical protein